MPLLASVCFVVLATGMTECQQPEPFDQARHVVEAWAEEFDPKLDKRYAYLAFGDDAEDLECEQLSRPLQPERVAQPKKAVAEDPEPEAEFVSKYNTRKYPGTPYAASGYKDRRGFQRLMEPVR